MPALTVIITGDAKKLQKEFDAINEMAKKTGQNIQTHLSGGDKGPGGGGGGGGHGGGKSGAIREAMVLMREMGRGNWSRVPGSLSILLSQLKLLPLLLNPVTIGMAVIAAGAYAANKAVSAMADKLSGLKAIDWNPEHIAARFQRANQGAEAQREVNREIQKSVELYNSASKAAERIAERTKEHFEHQRKMNAFAEEKELKLARTEQDRQRIRAKYASMEVQINRGERDQVVKNREAESRALAGESAQKLREANSIKVASKQKDEELLSQKKKAAEEGQKYLDDLNKKHGPGFVANAIEAVAGTWAATGFENLSQSMREKFRKTGAGADIYNAERGRIAEAHRRIQDAKGFTDTVASNDVKRQRQEDLRKAAAEAAAKGATVAMEARSQAEVNRQKNVSDVQEAIGKLEAEGAHNPRIMHGSVNSLQQVGAYASPAAIATLDVNRRQLAVLQQMLAVAMRGTPTTKAPPLSGAKF